MRLTRREFIKYSSITTASLLGLGCIGPSQQPSATPTPTATPSKEAIKIGWPVPVTGPIAPFGEPDPWVAKQVENLINSNGGIYLEQYGTEVPIKIIIKDTKSDPDFAATVAADLITREKVDLMLSLHTPATTVPVSGQCEKYQVPCISLDTPVDAWLSGGPYEWVYHAFWTVPDLIEVHLGMWDQVKDQTNSIGAGIWSDDPDGRTFRPVTLKLAEEKGYEFFDTGLVPEGISDFSPYISKWKNANVELLIGVFAPPDFATMWRQCRELNFVPKVCTFAKAILFPSAVEALGGDLAQGLTTELWWSPYHPFKSSLTGETAKELCEKYEKEAKKQWTQPIGYSHAAFEIAIDVLKRAGSVDKELLKETIADTNLDTIIGNINYKKPLSSKEEKRFSAFNPQLIEYQEHYSITPIVGCQWVKGKKWPWEIEIVYNWKYDEIPETAKMVLIGS